MTEKTDMEKLTGININQPIRRVMHSQLQRSDSSVFRSNCPACGKGVLLVHRNRDTGQLEEKDRCVLCGQLFLYTDIDEMTGNLYEMTIMTSRQMSELMESMNEFEKMDLLQMQVNRVRIIQWFTDFRELSAKLLGEKEVAFASETDATAFKGFAEWVGAKTGEEFYDRMIATKAIDMGGFEA